MSFWPLGANKIGFNLVYSHFNIHENITAIFQLKKNMIKSVPDLSPSYVTVSSPYSPTMTDSSCPGSPSKMTVYSNGELGKTFIYKIN